MAAATIERNEKTSSDKFVTCSFLAGVAAKVWKVENIIE
jgi:hypothetical protein